MIVLGITGGTGAGKTSALRVLARLGAYLIDCDALYYEMLAPGEPLHDAIGDAFGADMFLESGLLDRQKLGNRVFGAPEELTRLNQIIYRHIGDELARQIAGQQRLDTRCVAVDGINMIQARQAGCFRCDCMVGVIAPEELRLTRIMARDGISAAYARKRIDAQEPNSFYLDHCDVVLENTFENQHLFEASVEVFFEDLIRTCEKEKQL